LSLYVALHTEIFRESMMPKGKGYMGKGKSGTKKVCPPKKTGHKMPKGKAMPFKKSGKK